jgi:hypothetical protein
MVVLRKKPHPTDPSQTLTADRAAGLAAATRRLMTVDARAVYHHGPDRVAIGDQTRADISSEPSDSRQLSALARSMGLPYTMPSAARRG